MTIPPTSYGSISVPIPLEGEREGVLHTSDGSRRVNQQDFSRLQKKLVKGLIALAATNLTIGGSIVGLGAYYKNEGAIWGSMPFFAISVVGVFGLIVIRSFQGMARQEAHDSLSL